MSCFECGSQDVSGNTCNHCGSLVPTPIAPSLPPVNINHNSVSSHQSTVNHNVRKEIVNHQAPDTAKFLRELEEEAEKRVLSRTKLESNGFEVELLVFGHDPCDRENRVVVRFILNGKEHTVRATLEPWHIRGDFTGKAAPSGEAFVKLLEDLTRPLMEEVAQDIWKLLVTKINTPKV